MHYLAWNLMVMVDTDEISAIISVDFDHMAVHFVFKCPLSNVRSGK